MKISPQTRKLLLRMVALILVMMFGALMFMVIEGREQLEKTPLSLDEIKQNFLANHNIPEKDLEDLVEAVRNNTNFISTRIAWNFWNSLYFSVVLITTIGYGHLAPQTWEGQLFCIFYSLLGIPITALLLKSVGGYINIGINRLLVLVEERVLKRKLESRETKSFIISLVLMVFFLVFGGLFTSMFEGWTMIEGVYFTFVTLSTIGFGDFIVNEGKIVSDNMTKTVITPFLLIFMIVGLGVVSSVCFSISQIIESGGFVCCKRRRASQTLQEEDGDHAEGVELTAQA